jgi:hypothetical protein
MELGARSGETTEQGGRVRLTRYLEERVLASVTEADFQQQVIDLARLCSWRVYHTHDSRRSPAGFPDLCMVRSGRLIFAEIKVESVKRGRLTPDQIAWLHDLEQTGVEVYCWRPSDWDRIVEKLQR